MPHLDTDISPHGMRTFGDRVTTLGGNAVKAAAIDARKQLLAAAAEKLNTSLERLKIVNGIIYDQDSEKHISFIESARIASYKKAGATIIGKGSFVPPGVTMVDPETKIGNISCAYPFVTQIAEVEVNRVFSGISFSFPVSSLIFVDNLNQSKDNVLRIRVCSLDAYFSGDYSGP